MDDHKLKGRDTIKRYVTLFEPITAVELAKSPGMIPYYLARQVEGRIHVELAGYQDGDAYPEAERLSRRIRLNLIRPKNRLERKLQVRLYRYLISQSRRIDILHLYHFRFSTFLKALIYKLLNSKGRIYLKLDADWNIRNYFRFKRTVDPGYLMRLLIRKGLVFLSTWISIETPEILEFLTSAKDPELGRKIFLNHYGIDVESLETFHQDALPKENLLLTVARLGMHQKNTPFLLEVLKRTLPASGWKAYLIGSVDANFQPVVDGFYRDNPDLKDRVHFLGPVSDRRALMDYFNRSKIFCLTSRHESWGIVLTEALYFGCYVASTNVGCAPLVVKNEEFGFLTGVDEIDAYAEHLSQAMRKDKDWKTHRKICRERARNEFSWDKVVRNLIEKTNVVASPP